MWLSTAATTAAAAAAAAVTPKTAATTTTSTTTTSTSSTSSSSGSVVDEELDRRFLQTVNIEPPNFAKLWDTSGSSYKQACTIWRPLAPAGFFIVSDVIERQLHEQPRARTAVAVRDPMPGIEPPLLAPPAGFQKLCDTGGSGAQCGEMSLWTPIAPEVMLAC
jgi:hypothetical protein